MDVANKECIPGTVETLECGTQTASQERTIGEETSMAKLIEGTRNHVIASSMEGGEIENDQQPSLISQCKEFVKESETHMVCRT